MVYEMNIIKTRYAIEGKGLFVEYECVPVDFLVNIPIMGKDNKILGRAILTKNVHFKRNNGTAPVINETVVLTDIIVYDPDNRGEGIGDQIMGFITGSGFFNIIVTGISTEGGRELCLKWGFKQETIKGNKLLVWRKEHQDETVKRIE
jgi:hypothetical protein